MRTAILDVIEQLVGLRCEAADNPYGSILRLDFGDLGLRADDHPAARPHGWRHLTILSPWRVQSDTEVLVDWNVDGGANGLINPLVQQLVGQRVERTSTGPPAWDMSITFSGGVRLVIFGDRQDDRADAWFILGRDGIEVAAQPIIRPMEDCA